MHATGRGYISVSTHPHVIVGAPPRNAHRPLRLGWCRPGRHRSHRGGVVTHGCLLFPRVRSPPPRDPFALHSQTSRVLVLLRSPPIAGVSTPHRLPERQRHAGPDALGNPSPVCGAAFDLLGVTPNGAEMPGRRRAIHICVCGVDAGVDPNAAELKGHKWAEKNAVF